MKYLKNIPNFVNGGDEIKEYFNPFLKLAPQSFSCRVLHAFPPTEKCAQGTTLITLSRLATFLFPLV